MTADEMFYTVMAVLIGTLVILLLACALEKLDGWIKGE